MQKDRADPEAAPLPLVADCTSCASRAAGTQRESTWSGRDQPGSGCQSLGLAVDCTLCQSALIRLKGRVHPIDMRCAALFIFIHSLLCLLHSFGHDDFQVLLIDTVHSPCVLWHSETDHCSSCSSCAMSAAPVDSFPSHRLVFSGCSSLSSSENMSDDLQRITMYYVT